MHSHCRIIQGFGPPERCGSSHHGLTFPGSSQCSSPRRLRQSILLTAFCSVVSPSSNTPTSARNVSASLQFNGGLGLPSALHYLDISLFSTHLTDKLSHHSRSFPLHPLPFLLIPLCGFHNLPCPLAGNPKTSRLSVSCNTNLPCCPFPVRRLSCHTQAILSHHASLHTIPCHSVGVAPPISEVHCGPILTTRPRPPQILPTTILVVDAPKPLTWNPFPQSMLSP